MDANVTALCSAVVFESEDGRTTSRPGRLSREQEQGSSSENIR